MLSTLELFNEAKQLYTISEIAKKLNVVSGTVSRWNVKQEVPSSYYFDLMKLLNKPIDYSEFSYKDKDQFFTSQALAKKCVDICYDVFNELNININDYIFVEPSAGNGIFLPYLPDNTLAFDIEPRQTNIIQQDFLDWEPNLNQKYIVIGNPPFGLRGQKALQFINKAFTFCDFVCFILPPLFNSDGKGSPKKRINQHLIFSNEIDTNLFTYPDGNTVEINTIFQIWTKLDFNIDLNETIIPIGYQVYSLSDGGTPSTTRNKDKLNKCDYYLPSTVFGKEKIKLYPSFEDLPQHRGYGIIVENNDIKSIIENINWSDIAFLSTNNAANLRTSLIVKAIENNKENNNAELDK